MQALKWSHLLVTRLTEWRWNLGKFGKFLTTGTALFDSYPNANNRKEYVRACSLT